MLVFSFFITVNIFYLYKVFLRVYICYHGTQVSESGKLFQAFSQVEESQLFPAVTIIYHEGDSVTLIE